MVIFHSYVTVYRRIVWIQFWSARDVYILITSKFFLLWYMCHSDVSFVLLLSLIFCIYVYMIYGIWQMIFDKWYLIYDIWFMIDDIWYIYIYMYIYIYIATIILFLFYYYNYYIFTKKNIYIYIHILLVWMSIILCSQFFCPNFVCKTVRLG